MSGTVYAASGEFGQLSDQHYMELFLMKYIRIVYWSHDLSMASSLSKPYEVGGNDLTEYGNAGRIWHQSHSISVVRSLPTCDEADRGYTLRAEMPAT